jgi:hypothetical protein
MDISEVRRQRDLMLEATDHFMIPDWPMSAEEKTAWTDYRQALRDITLATEFSDDNDFWPNPPRRYTFKDGVGRPNSPADFVGAFEN